MSRPDTATLVYDTYFERFWTKEELVEELKLYLQVAKRHMFEPEITELDQINDENCGHVTYHASIQRDHLEYLKQLEREAIIKHEHDWDPEMFAED